MRTLLALSLSLVALSAADLTIAGSSTVFPVVAEAAKDYAGAKITVGQGGSSDGIKKLAEGSIAIAMSSRALKEPEAAKGLVTTAIGTDGIALVVNSANPVANLTDDQVREAFSGATTDWSALGGDAGPVVLVSSHEAHGTTEGFAHYFKMQFKGDATAKAMTYAPKDGAYGTITAIRTATHQETAAKIATNPKALGFMPIGAIQEIAKKGTPIKAISLNGIVPSAEAVTKGTWPVTRPLLLVTKGAPTDAAKEFIDFMTSDKGQALVVKHGFVGVTK